MDLRLLERTAVPNDSLACPSGVCRTKPDFESPLFHLGKNDLMKQVAAVIMAEPRTELVGEDPALGQLVFVQRSALLRFPDTIWIQAVDATNLASIIVYSRSNYGYWDLGVNRKRVRAWLDKLESALEKEPGGRAEPPS